MKEINARIEKLEISNDDFGGILTMWLILDYGGGTGQGFGGFALYSPAFPKIDLTGLFITMCMEIAGVNNLLDIVEKPIRVKLDEGGKIIEIGHFLEDRWFNPKYEFEQLEKRR